MKNLKPHWIAVGIIGISLAALGWSSSTPHADQPYHSSEEMAAILAAAGDLPTGQNALFAGSGLCAGCHGLDPDGLAFVTESGWNINPTDFWRASIMANSSKDPWWRAKVTHETAVNPAHAGIIEHKCTSCHTPSGHFNHNFENPGTLYTFHEAINDSLGLDGVSCASCHQQDPDGLGTRFTGNLTFVEDTIFGPFGGGKNENPIFGAPMTNFVGFEPVYGAHMGKSELCAGCHTLITEAITPSGEISEGLYFVEQATYHEWLNSEYASESPSLRRECQSCHMPKINTEVVVSSGYSFLQPRGPITNHYMVGSNTFMLEMFKNNIELLGIAATETQFDSTIAYTLDMLQNQSVLMDIEESGYSEDTLAFEIRIENLAGHKFPSGYPARRAYIEFIATAENGDTLFHSGALQDDYEVAGHDEDFEPHYDVIRAEDEVQIYELVIGSTTGDVTTVLLRGAEPLKDNRLTPRGFSMNHPAYDTTLIAGNALNDPNFNFEGGFEGSGTDNITYRIGLNGYEGEVNVVARMHYQASPPKWNEEMFAFNTPEIDLFRDLYEQQGAMPVLVKEASATATVSHIAELKKPKFSVFPNPTSDGMVTVARLPEGYFHPSNRIRVFNMQGKLVLDEPMLRNQQQIQLPAAGGSYIIAIDTPRGMLTQRVVKL